MAMTENESSTKVKKALSAIKVKADSSEIFQKMIDQGDGLTFNHEGIPLVYKQYKNYR